MQKIINLIKKHKKIILYLIIGGLTTVLNYATYWFFAYPLEQNELFSNAIAWFVGVVFAYITNKLFVFESKSFKAMVLFSEILSFFLSRLSTLLLETGIMALFVTWLGFNDLIVKAIANLLVIIANYFLSEFIVFRKKKKIKNEEVSQK